METPSKFARSIMAANTLIRMAEIDGVSPNEFALGVQENLRLAPVGHYKYVLRDTMEVYSLSQEEAEAVLRFCEDYEGRLPMGNYYDNSHLCGECTGAGCKHCFQGLSGIGNERFPLSRAINGCQPPYIQNPYAGKLSPRMAAHIILTSRTMTKNYGTNSLLL